MTYTLEFEGKFYIVENVPARVNEETGEQFFSPATVERLQKIVPGKIKSGRVIEALIYDYSELCLPDAESEPENNLDNTK